MAKIKNEGQFKFNLISKRSKEEITILQERDNTTIYSFILIFAGVLIYFVLTLFQFSFVDSKLQSIEDDISATKNEITNYNEVQSLNGELFLKSNLLTPVLEKDIKVNDFLEVTAEIIGSSEIISYSRESNGEFVVNTAIDNYEQALEIIGNAKVTEGITDIKVRDISFDSLRFNKYVLIIQFGLEQVDEEAWMKTK